HSDDQSESFLEQSQYEEPKNVSTDDNEDKSEKVGYTCEICQHLCSRDLERHLIVEHMNCLLYHCLLCDQSFKTTHDAMVHCREIHKDKTKYFKVTLPDQAINKVPSNLSFGNKEWMEKYSEAYVEQLKTMENAKDE
ncbi:unnamed protein product, partial [Owenia fusiformis]